MMGKRRGTAQITTASAGSLRSQQSTQKPALFATRSLAVYSRRNMILKPSLSFAGPREYSWQGLEVPAMMGKRRGTAQITTASAGSLRSQLSTQKPALLNSIARCVPAGETCVQESSLSFAGPREYRWQGLDVPVMMGKRRGTETITTASPGVCATSYQHKNLLFSTRSLAVYQQVKHASRSHL